MMWQILNSSSIKTETCTAPFFALIISLVQKENNNKNYDMKTLQDLFTVKLKLTLTSRVFDRHWDYWVVGLSKKHEDDIRKIAY